jgi:hypothetical protein
MMWQAQLIDDLRLLEPPDPWLLYYWAGGILATLLLALIVWAIVRNIRRKRSGSGGPGDVWGAQEDALQALEALFDLVHAGRGRHYAIESSAIIRRYIERRYRIRASQQSTEEFLHEAQHAPELSGDHQRLLREFLHCCDFLKFARGLASRAELQELHSSAVAFVRNTEVTQQEVRG